MGEAKNIYFTCLNCRQNKLSISYYFRRSSAVRRSIIRMSADLTWMVVRNTSSLMVKGRLSKSKTFTKGPLSLTGIHSMTSSGLIGRKAVGIQAAADNKGVVVVTKKTKLGAKPSASLNSVTLKKGRRAVLTSVANSVKSYDKSKKSAAMKRASAVLRSQRPRVGKKTKKD